MAEENQDTTKMTGNEKPYTGEYTEELGVLIRELVLEGLSDVEIYNELGIPVDTWKQWKYRNVHTFDEKLTKWRRMYMAKKAELVLQDLLTTGDKNIRYKTAKFLTETLEKDTYSKKTEIYDGRKPKRDLPPNMYDEMNNSIDDDQNETNIGKDKNTSPEMGK